MNANEAIELITGAVTKALKIKLAPGETCPCCGHKKQDRRQISEKMLAANRRNLEIGRKARGLK